MIGATQTPTVHVSKKRMVLAALTANGNVVGLLEQAYALLSNADHDYKGHRIHAMHAIKAAARELGVPLKGGGKGREQQGTSDSQLRGLSPCCSKP